MWPQSSPSAACKPTSSLSRSGCVERREIRAADRGAAQIHPRADLEARHQHRRTRPDRVDHHHVEAVAHGQMHGQRGAFGEFDQERPRARADVEVAQKAVAQFQHRRGQHEALAVGQPEQEARADQRGGDARDGGLGNAGQFGQFAIAERRVGGGDRAQHGQAAGKRGDFIARAVFVFGRARRRFGRAWIGSCVFWNFISIYVFAAC